MLATSTRPLTWQPWEAEMERLVVILLGLLPALSACATLAPVTCGGAEMDPPPRLTCDVALDAAREKLASVAGITALRFEYAICPPNARCMWPNGDVGTVTATLAGGDAVQALVHIDPEGIVQAGTPQPVMTPAAEPAG